VKTFHSVLLLLCLAVPSLAQNIIEDGDSGKTAPPISISSEQVETMVHRVADFSGAIHGAEAGRIREKLEGT
jgi:hypothetical protein